MNYTLLKKQILIQIRGLNTQTEISKSIGFSFNQVGKWESDAKRMKWIDFFDYCLFFNISIDKILRDILMSQTEDMRQTSKVLNCLKTFHSLLSIDELARKINCHPSVMRRWLSGKVEPDVEFVFMLINLRENLLSSFVEKIVDIKKIDVFHERHEISHHYKEEFIDPILVSVWIAIRVNEYQKLEKHKDEVLAQLTGLTNEDVRFCLSQLIKMKILSFEDEKYKIIGEYPFKHLYGEKAFVGKLRSYWSERSLTRFVDKTGIAANHKQRANLQGFYMTSVSKSSMTKITDRLHRAFEEVIQIANESHHEEQEDLRVILIDVFSPDDAPVNHNFSKHEKVENFTEIIQH